MIFDTSIEGELGAIQHVLRVFAKSEMTMGVFWSEHKFKQRDLEDR